MEGYAEATHSISVPKNTGVDGFLRTLRSILSLPRVQSISIDSSGNVQYKRYVREGETDTPISIDYRDLEPWGIIRNKELEEVSLPSAPAASVICYMLNRLTQDSLVPIAFAVGTKTEFWDWHERTSGVRLARTGAAYGIPIYTDREIPDSSLILCGAYVRGSLIDCHRFLSTSMSKIVYSPPDTSVEIL